MWFRALFIFIFSFFTLSFTLSPYSYAHSQTQVIEMTTDGFSPSSAVVDQNQAVIFVNKDKVAHWPASNVHPTHDIYPEFDPQKGVEPGQSWVFKPKKVGTWKYHDHLFTHIRGEIKVLAEEGEVIKDKGSSFNLADKIKDFVARFVAGFKKALNLRRDYQLLSAESFVKLSPQDQIKKLKELSDNLGAKKAWEYINNTFKGQSGSSGNIHDLAHYSGSLIFENLGFEGLVNCSPEFAFGCYHGFLDQAFKKDLTHLLDAQNACLKLGPEGSGPVASCIHGIGHGVASFHSTTDLKASLDSCRKLTSGREYCFDGVFMEFVRSAPDSLFKPADPLSMCTDLEKEHGPIYSFACGRNIPSLLLSRLNKSFDDVVNICRNANSKSLKEACFDSLGFSLSASGDVEKIVAGCRAIQIPEFVLRCAKAAAGELVFQDVPNWQDKSREICEAFLDRKADCLVHVDRLSKEYGRVKKLNFKKFEKGEDPNVYIRTQMGVCYETDGAGGCYKKVAQVLYESFGLAETLKLLRVNEGYPEVYARCHEVTHYLSRSEYERLHSISKVYAQCDSTCHGGCYHGTLEAFLKEKEAQFGENLGSEFARVCGTPSDYQKPLEFNECLHGMGHAAMFITEMELKDSLALCDGFGGQDEKERCYSGVFMENSSSSTSNDHQSTFLRADDPFYPCDSLDERYLSLCWQYQSSYFSIISHHDWVKVSDMCLQIPEQYQERCFRTIGTNQVGFTSSLERMRDDCNLMPDQFKSTCVVGVISSLTYRFVGEIQRMVDFCSIVNSPQKESCYRQIGTGVLDWANDKNMAKKECTKIPDPQGQGWCIGVI